MSTPAGEIHLTGGSAAIELKRARLEAIDVEYDTIAFRAPYGTEFHTAGSGHARPTIVRVSGVLEGATVADSDALVDSALAALASVTALLIGAWSIPISGATGTIARSATLRGWRLTIDLIASDTNWTANP